MALSSYSTMVTDTGGLVGVDSKKPIDKSAKGQSLGPGPGLELVGGVLVDPATGKPPVASNGGGGGYGGSSGGVAAPAYTAPTLPSATSQEEYIRAMYAANQARQDAALRTAYDANVGTLDQQAAKIPSTYDAAANKAAAQSAVNRQSFNEAAAASGTNTGAGSQARLSQNNALQGNISAIRQAQAQALADVDAQRTQLSLQYQNAIAEAVAQNELQKAQALYDEAKRVDESIVATAANQAQLNFSAWRANY